MAVSLKCGSETVGLEMVGQYSNTQLIVLYHAHASSFIATNS